MRGEPNKRIIIFRSRAPEKISPALLIDGLRNFDLLFLISGFYYVCVFRIKSIVILNIVSSDVFQLSCMIAACVLAIFGF